MIIFYPISLLFGFFVSVREFLYKVGILPAYKVKAKVISVGNLTFGGTGKTPIVDFLVENLKKRKKIAILSRGYGRSTPGFFKVSPNEPNAESKYGDEPVLLSKNHPDVPVYVSEDRVKGARQIENDVNLIVADDAFQHLKLKRDIDIVIIDATEKLQNYNYPPVGRARNSFSYLKKAKYVFLTKTNLCSKENLVQIKNKIKNSNVIEFESLIDGLYNLSDSQKTLVFQEVFLISGIGKPQTFEDLVLKSFPNIIIKEHFIFKDHHPYTEADVLKIKSKIGNSPVLTTEKDAVKLKKFSHHLNACVTKLKFVTKFPTANLFKDLAR